MLTPAQLALELAARAQVLKALTLRDLERERTQGPLHALLAELGEPDEREFASAYAQTVTYGLLAARWLSSDRTELRFTRRNIGGLLRFASPSVRALFQRLVNSRFRPELAAALDDMIGLLAQTDLGAVFAGERDPAIHFYQDFLDAYDPQIRKHQGVYYTPDELVEYIVGTAHTALQERFGLALGLADPTSWAKFAAAQGLAVPAGIDGDQPFVQILDPASGTGTFLLRVIELVHATMIARYADQGLDSEASARAWVTYVRAQLLPRLNGLERGAAPCIVSHLRLGLALARTGFVFDDSDHLQVFLTNTLAIDGVAERVKHDGPISVILGNPPYLRESAEPQGGDQGGWIRAGWAGWRGGRAPLEDFIEPTRRAGAGGHLKNLYNLYVYFWRWATWRVFERFDAPGIVALVTGSSFLRGPAFVGMREQLRRLADDIYIVDLEGGQRGTRITDNVFCITTPVCVGSLIVDRAGDRSTPANTHYRRVSGSRADKLSQCAAWARLAAIEWSPAPAGLQSPMLSGGAGDYGGWPLLTAIWPWQHSGVQFKRTWPIAATAELLRRRWAALLDAPARAEALRETSARTISKTVKPLVPGGDPLPAIASLGPRAACPTILGYGFRSFDRQWALVDERLGDRLRPRLWRVFGARQVYLTSLLSGVLGDGPAATVSAFVPDLHHFRGSFGGKDVIPLWRDSAGKTANLAPTFCASLAAAWGSPPSAEAMFAYTYAVLANPGYVERFKDELQVPGPRLPVTKDRAVFERGAALGAELLRWHTYGARFCGRADRFALSGIAAVQSPISAAAACYPRCYSYAPQRETLQIGDGEIGPITARVWGFRVSGLSVVKSWLDYRMQGGAGRRSSPLDDLRPARWTPAMTQELLELLWVLDWTLAQYPALDAWLAEVLDGDLLRG